MKFTHLYGLLWEQSRRIGPYIGSIVVIACSLMVVVSTLSAQWTFIEAGFWLNFVFANSLIATGLILIFGHSTANALTSAFPIYALRLPVTTFGLVALRMGFNLAAFFATAGLLRAVARHLYGQTPYESIDDVFFVFGLLFLYLHAMSWFTGAMESRGQALAAMILPFVVFGIASLAVKGVPVPDMSLLEILAVGVLVAFVLSYIGVQKQRRGESIRFGELDELLTNLSARIGFGDGDFDSPEAAQTWYEWRRFGMLLPAAALGFGLFLACLGWAGLVQQRVEWTSRTEIDDWKPVWHYFVAQIPVGVFVSVIAGAIAAGVDIFLTSFSMQNTRSSFYYIRPMSTRALATSRFRAALRSLVVAGLAGLVVAAMAFLIRLWFAPEYLIPETGKEQVGVAVLMLVYLGAFVGGLGLAWCVMWLDAVALLFIVMMVGLVIIAPLAYTGVGGEAVEWLQVVLMLVVLTAAFRMARRSQVVDATFLRKAVWILPIALATGIIAMNFDSLILFGTIDDDAVLPALIALTVFLLLPLATTPLIIHWMRHR